MGLVKKLKKMRQEKFDSTEVMAQCGHMTRLAGEVEAFGEKYHFRFNGKADEAPQYCLDCLGKTAIRCAWCGEPIFIGDAVTLYGAKKGFEVPDGAVVYQEKPRIVVGCLRWDCADTGADRAGFWVYPGEVKRVASPLELCLSTGGVVMASDVSDPAGSVTIFPDD